jgi:flagella basal body P-ring formation protein FlgA
LKTMNDCGCLVKLVVIGLSLATTIARSQTSVGSANDEDVWLQIHLPREVTVTDASLDLGRVAVVRGAQKWATLATGIGLGRFSLPGQKIVLDRATVLSRLAASGIPRDRVLLTGADAVTVTSGQTVIESEEFVHVGRQFLQRLLSGRSVVEMLAVIRPKDLALSSPISELQWAPRVVHSDARGLVTIQVRVIADGQELGVRDVSFRLKYEVHQAVTSKEIAEGAVLTAENVKIGTKVSDRPEQADWRPPYGLVTTRALAADTEIRPDMVGVAQDTVLVRRNEVVMIRFERPGLLVTAMGTVLQEGRTGEAVKVRNVDSSRIIVCKVNADGTVEPVL